MRNVLRAVLVIALSGFVIGVCGCSLNSHSARFLFAGNTTTPTSVSAFVTSATTVTAVGGSPFTTNGNSPLAMAVANKRFLYAAVPSNATANGGVMMMPIASGGILGTPQMYGTGDYDGLAVTSNGKFLYAADIAGSLLAAYSINGNTGALSTIGPVGGLAVGPDPFNVRVDPLGKFVFVASCSCTAGAGQAGAVWVFRINSDGTLTAVPNSPFGLSTTVITHPFDVVVSPDSKYLFVASWGDTSTDNDQVYAMNIAADGSLSSAGAPVSLATVGSFPNTITVTPDGKFLYTANAGSMSISPISVGTNGALSYQSDLSLGWTPATVLVPSAGGVLYVSDYDGSAVVAFSINGSGSLTQSSSTPTGGTNPIGLAILQQ